MENLSTGGKALIMFLYYCAGDTCDQDCVRNSAGNKQCTVRGCCAEHVVCTANRGGTCYAATGTGDQQSEEAQLLAQKLTNVLREMVEDDGWS